jgi:ribose transport system ATP-binding protein
MLQVRELTKSYDAVQALRGVSVDIRAGETHGLIGANGAGKSTLIRALAGAVHPDGGRILLDGEEITIPDPHSATGHGFAFLHQELNLVPTFSALENMCLGTVAAGPLGFAKRKPAHERARAVASDIGFDFPLDKPVRGLSVAQRGLVAMGRSLMQQARTRLIAFDEPTASLSAAEAQRLFEIIGRLTANGVAVLYVSHRLEEVARLCQRVTAFRDGQVVANFAHGDITKQAMISVITGGTRDTEAVPARRDSGASDSLVLEARHVTRLPAVQDVSIELRKGEMLGLAGLVGAGRTELARVLCGVDKRDSGEIAVDGNTVAMSSATEAVALGLGLVPEERRSQGLFLDKNAIFNVNIGSPGSIRFGLTSPKGARVRARGVAERVDLRPPNIDRPVRLFSGGNQQKLVLGRWLLGERKVLILDEPTRGIDVGARAQIHRMLRTLAEEGLALLIISSDFEELLNCDRVLVMATGRIVAELTGEAITEQNMLHAAYETTPPEVTLREKEISA